MNKSQRQPIAKVRRTAAALVGLMLTGCSSFVVQERVDHPMRKIALLSVPPAGNYFIEQAGYGGNYRVNNQLFEGESFEFSSYLEQTLADQLRAKGIEVVVVPFKRENPRKLSERYDGIAANLSQVDAVLEVLPASPGYNLGQIGERSLTRLRPMVGIQAQLMSVHTHAVVFRDRFGFGYQVPKSKEDDAYVFEDSKALESNPKAAVGGLKHATESVVAYLVDQIVPEAGMVFSQAKPKMAVYAHIVLLSSEKIPEPTLDDVVAETRQTYAGPLTIGEDLMSFEIGDTVTVKPYRR
jgi:hypothetical protein